MPKCLFTLWLAALLAACATFPTSQARRAHADTLAAARGWQSLRVPVDGFVLQAYLPVAFGNDDRLTVYIEGDGFAWVDSSTPSTDPTPNDPLALRLALAQPTGNVVYLARPCQFVDTDAPGCAQRYWTEARFAPEVVGATGQAIDVLKRHAGARRLMLVGYSGGGAVAALVAARRDDVERLVTVAGNLDHRTWAAFHHLSPLTESLNPADEVDALRRIPQLHFVGSRDTVIPPRQAVDFAALFPAGQRPMIRVEAGFDHRCCWAEQWKNLWRFVTAQP